tara:strand:- start:869 stop:1504 length:636 start_codon:yes stop_codon:yes gene_type:complete
MLKIFFISALFSPLSLFSAEKVGKDIQVVSQDAHKKSEPENIPDIRIGSSEAPIKIIEYSSLTCHHCAHFHKTVLPVLMKKYIRTGKMQLVFRHFPIDEYALKASTLVAASIPLRQFSLVNRLFETQDRWIGSHCLDALAHITGETLETCQETVNNKALSDRVLMTRLRAEKEMNIDGTPTFIINGRVIDYAPELDEIETLIKPYLDAMKS